MLDQNSVIDIIYHALMKFKDIDKIIYMCENLNHKYLKKIYREKFEVYL
jgi:hypothetical protein